MRIDKTRPWLQLLLVVALLGAAGRALAYETPSAAFARANSLYAAGEYAAARLALRDLADRRFAPAQAMLGMIYLSGAGIAPNPAIAAIWFYKSARLGYPPAQFAFAQLRASGTGIARDEEDAYLWLSLVIERARPEIKARAETLKRVIGDRLTADQRERIGQRAAAWRPDGAILE